MQQYPAIVPQTGMTYQDPLAHLQQQAQQLQQQYQQQFRNIQQQYNPMMQQQSAYQAQQSAQMACTPVSCIDEVRAAMVSPTGAPSVFFAPGLDCFFKKQIMPNGLPDIAMYQRVQPGGQQGQQGQQQPQEGQQGSNQQQGGNQELTQRLEMMQQEIERLKEERRNAGMASEPDVSGASTPGSTRRGKSANES